MVRLARIGVGNANCPNCYGDETPSHKSRKPFEVGSFRPNNFGLYDMLGNVSEIVQDCWVRRFVEKMQNKNLPCKKRTVRGGNYFKGHSYLPRVSMRASLRLSREFSSPFVGFRIYRKIN